MAEYDRLSAQDMSFLLAETSTSYMHVGATQIFERGELGTEDGGLDFESIKKATAAVLHRIPRYRQRLQWAPVFDRPVWVDDRDFNLDYHMRHTSLPRPGSLAQLKRLSARVMAQQLDRQRPLWEIWVVEGLEGGRFAWISKVHHCMIDGASGVDLAQVLLSITPEQTIAEAPRYVPRPAPSGLELMRDETLRRVLMPLKTLRGLRELRRETDDLGGELRARAKAVGDLLGWAIHPASDTPINGNIGPHRRFDWLTLPLADVKAVRKAAGCSVNDVVLTTVTGALREYLSDRGSDPRSLDFRISAPVSIRRDDERGALGNRVSSWIVQLPLDEPTPQARLQRIHEATRELKESRQAMGVEMMMEVAEWTPPVLLSLGAQAVSGPINSIVTNVPGPQFPLYMLGARLLAMYPMVPLLPGMGLGIALFSYDGRVCWGFNADFDLVPDLERIPGLVEHAFQDFAASLGVEVSGSTDA
jgi:WS/DGAT/MGAT family acyltransferase